MTFERRYGGDFAKIVHVHHLQPISLLGKTRRVDPIEDMRPVCPNCHAALHHRRDQPYTPAELKRKLRRDTGARS